MGIEDYSKEDKSKDRKSEPHKDWKKNVDELYEKMKSAWMPTCEYEINAQAGQPFGNYTISDTTIENIFDHKEEKKVTMSRVKEYKCVTFVWGIKGKNKNSRPISFHQNNYVYNSEECFSNELVGILNRIKKDLFK